MNWLTSHLVDDWKQALKWLSVQIHIFALFYVSLYEIMPTLDPSIAHLLPSPMRAPAIGIYATLAIVARLIAQKKPNG